MFIFGESIIYFEGSTMGCIQSAPVDRPKRKKKKESESKKGKKGASKGAAAKRANATPSNLSKNPTGIPAGADKQKPASNPLNFTKEEDKQSERRPSANSSSASLRGLLATQSTGDVKAVDHTPLSEGKRKNLCVWIDSIEKLSLLDPQDFSGQQRREREIAGRQQQMVSGGANGKRRSILMSFATVEQSRENDAEGSIAVGHDDHRSASSNIGSEKV